jgi:hypothetical protein
VITAQERELGLVEFHCDAHGFLCVTFPKASALCRCGKFGRRLLSGRIVDPDTLRPTEAKARAMNVAGEPVLFICECGADFGGSRLFQRHRVGRGSKRRCLTFEEMLAKGWHEDEKGRWRQNVASPEGLKRASETRKRKRQAGG